MARPEFELRSRGVAVSMHQSRTFSIGRYDMGATKAFVARTVATVLEAMALGPAGRQGQNRVEPVERRNGRLLIDAEHGRMPGRLQIQTEDVGPRCVRTPDRRWPVTLPSMGFKPRPAARCAAPCLCRCRVWAASLRQANASIHPSAYAVLR